MIAQKLKVAVIIPAHNEQVVIEKTLMSLIRYVSKKDIYVVDDGSSDNTAKIARKLGGNVARLTINQGKGNAINFAIKRYNLITRYDLIMPLDADTLVLENFFPLIKKRFESDKQRDIACVIGRVTGKAKNWLTSYRIWEYEIGQSIHKQAQSVLGGIMVCPGCATVYRAQIFTKVEFPTHSLAEDMDLTFNLHRKKLGSIVYEDGAEVMTQDPIYLSDYVKQIDRWYTGLWQNIIKHQVPWKGQVLDLECAFIASEGLFTGLIWASMIILLPMSIKVDPMLFVYPLILDIGLFLVPTILYTSIKRRPLRIFIYLPHFYLLRLISSYIFLISFFKVMINQDSLMHWFSPHRYLPTKD